MPNSPERQLRPDSSQWVVQALTRLYCTYAVVQGIFVIHGGRQRWSAPAFESALNVPGAPASWGVALLIVGVLGIYGTFTKKMIAVFYAMGGIAVWFMFFTISQFYSALNNPLAATTGVFTYGTMGVTSVVLGALYRFSSPRN